MTDQATTPRAMLARLDVLDSAGHRAVDRIWVFHEVTNYRPPGSPFDSGLRTCDFGFAHRVRYFTAKLIYATDKVNWRDPHGYGQKLPIRTWVDYQGREYEQIPPMDFAGRTIYARLSDKRGFVAQPWVRQGEVALDLAGRLIERWRH